MSLGRKAKIVNTIINPETGSSESDVIYIPDYLSVLKEIKTLRKTILELDNEEGINRDKNWEEVINNVNKLTLNFVRYIKDNNLEQIDETNVTGGEGFSPKINKGFIRKNYLNTINEQTDYNNIDDPALRSFIEKRLNSYNDIEKALNIIIELLKKAKANDENNYLNNPSFTIHTSTSTILSYLKDIITILK